MATVEVRDALRVSRGDRFDRFLPVALVVAGLASGYALATIGGRFGELGPFVLTAIPIIPAITLAILNDPRWGVVAIVATLPIGVIAVPVLPLQLVQLAVVGVATLVALHRLAAGATPLPVPPAARLLLVFCTWLLVAFPSARDHALASREIVLFVIGVVTSLVIVAACKRTDDVRLALGALLAVIAGVAATVPLNVDQLRSAYGGAIVTGRATGIFVEPNQMGTFAATGALIGLGLAFGCRTTRGRALSGVGASMCVLALLLSLSRGAWIGFAVGAVVLTVKLGEVRRWLIAGATPLFLVALLIGSFAPTTPQVEIVGERLRSITGERNPYDNRPALWREAIHEIETDPLTGHGPGNFRIVSRRSTSASRTVKGEHAHNLALTWGAEDGLPAVLIAAGFGVVLHLRLRRAGRSLDRHGRAVAAGVAAALAAVAGQGMVDYTLHNSVILTTLFLLIGCAIALGANTRAR